MAKLRQHINRKKKLRERKRAKKSKAPEKVLDFKIDKTKKGNKFDKLLKNVDKQLPKTAATIPTVVETPKPKPVTPPSRPSKPRIEATPTGNAPTKGDSSKPKRNNRWKKLKAELKAKKRVRREEPQVDPDGNESAEGEETEPTTSIRDDLLNLTSTPSEGISVPLAPATNNQALKKLRVAQFRILNETLYTTESAQAEGIFKNDQRAFQIYHEGYRSQVNKWPMNPLVRIISDLKELPKYKEIADMGCGDARLAAELKPLGYRVHSFDLVAANEHVTACNIRKTPLKDGSVDVVVMCLSLMGTDMGQFVLEANRILKIEGLLKIAEVESRIPAVESFVKVMKRYGFTLVSQNVAHAIFQFFDFKKSKSVPKGAENSMDKKLWLKPCLYKKR